MGLPGGGHLVLRRHVRHQLDGGAAHQRHRLGPVHLRQLQEARWANRPATAGVWAPAKRVVQKDQRLVFADWVVFLFNILIYICIFIYLF